MATYEKTTFVDGAAPAITANELNKIGNGILEALSNTENLTTSVSNLSTRVSNIESSIGTSGNIGTKVANSLSTITWDDSAKKLTKTTNSGTTSNVFTASELKADLGITIADTTGTVPVNRGGTGVQTFTSNAVLYGNGTNGIGAKASANGALYATQANGALSWGTLPIAQGGTGKTSASEAWTALGGGAIGKKASLAASDIPDISTAKLTSGTLEVARGGTGQTSLQATRNAMGLGNTTGALPVGNGGTGATTAADARTNLGITPSNIGAAPTVHYHSFGDLTSGTLVFKSTNNYGTTVPSTGSNGQVFFKY